MMVASIVAPCSKLATARGIGSETLSTYMGATLGLESVDADELYEALDWLVCRPEKTETALAQRHLSDGSLVLYDVTSAYSEGRTCPTAKRGHNRDKKKGQLQIVIRMLCNAEGCPVSVQVFEGNTGDPKTLAPRYARSKSDSDSNGLLWWATAACSQRRGSGKIFVRKTDWTGSRR